jgi:dihydroorotase
MSPHYLRLAKEVARTAGIPLMVHIFGPDPLPEAFSFSEILEVLERGDIITHTFHPIHASFDAFHSIFDRETNIITEVMEARNRGVLFDVGHGRYQFSWHIAEKAIQHGFLPDTISSDLTKYSVNTIVYDLPTVLSKFLHSGLSLSEVVERSTINPAKVLGMNERIGTLKPGAEGDVAIFQLDEGKYALWDNLSSQREQRIITQRLNPIHVIKAGQIIQ